jgi:hypothetical protein
MPGRRSRRPTERQPWSGPSTDPDSVEAITQGVIDGTIPPDLKGFYRFKPLVVAELAKRGHDLTKSSSEYAAYQRQLSTLNGNQQTKLRQDVTRIPDVLELADEQYEKLSALVPQSRAKPFNEAVMKVAQNMGGEAGAAANNLSAAVNELVALQASIYMNGNTPTEQAIQLAKHNLIATVDKVGWKAAKAQVLRNAKISAHALAATGPAGTAENRYAPPGSISLPPATGAVGKGRVAPAGTKLMKNVKGEVGPVPEARIEEAKKAGYTVVE